MKGSATEDYEHAVDNSQPSLNVQVENALVDRILELFNATKLTSHQAKLLLDRVRVLIELGERVASTKTH